MKKYCYVPIILLIIFLIIYIPYVTQYNINKEKVFSSHQEEIDLLDINGDGYLDFDEAKLYRNITPESKLLEFFNKADKNKNNLLKGAEFDTYRYLIKDYEEKLKIKSIKNSSSTNNNSNSNNYNNKISPDYELWEGEEIVGYDDGYPIYVCTYYTSGDRIFNPGVYTAIGNDYSGWSYEYESSNWQQIFKYS